MYLPNAAAAATVSHVGHSHTGTPPQCQSQVAKSSRPNPNRERTGRYEFSVAELSFLVSGVQLQHHDASGLSRMNKAEQPSLYAGRFIGHWAAIESDRTEK